MIPVPGFEGRRVAVFGLGRSGITAARALKAGGATPILWDDGVSGRLQAQAEGFVVEDLTTADWSGFAALVLSPGAPLTHPKPHWTVDKARAAGVPVVGDIELFARALDALPEGRRPWVIAITGTNGKSTTTALIGWVLQQAGLTVHVGGNIGIGVLALPEPTPGAVYVIEVSSYQLDLTTGFAPDAAILTNISPDHLDRHGGMEGYVAAKRRIFQSRKTAPYVGIDDPYGFAIWQELKAEGRAVDPVSVERPMDDDLGMYLMDDWLTYNAGGRPAPIVDLSKARSLPGRHNAQNAAFAFLAVNDMGIPEETVVKGLLTFPGLAHRMEAVGHIGHVRFINDSKATNADAARQALASYPKVFWIAGGKPKDGGIDDLADLFPRVAKAYLIGEAAEAFAATLGDTPHVISKTMDAAVVAAAADAASAGGDQIVLLSPACASFDQYPDFEVRGEAFRAAVLNLGATPETAR
ncbi:MAG: UDP-N-acetylmuramoyl-L-alanine--D-glutamate ligase [Brevundimonas sp.]|jgi:UDP-N-acetylmuramoylalanine--D-glutamate ligase|uniref:UDP-N-acetylmuramoylalanine--D-glutamate ligase n=1 Tax=Brevundimonas mediterranea TaxID=74329 RepID=A0AB37E8E8_9CAUL|nr:MULTISPECIES: UDP-N-acetylmuramoyl-L-alanine--D-glutamate ligase [Brevundimonas]EDX80712.1 UDP-N-acetylmuramoylalanine--D-glutamate ligase [Brevundimonas sp. BAL3]MBA4332837.1 UDP-N-acetylmuramoyl-L-alanine--D-glutamate ligase [Brevundimonas sp.]OYX81079.1 MAG: UDP-N-acetylmuramoyl-L-alanine--D-glutamate ligase [Brevundimonas sp. 32-68-21]QIH73636.1 UDP-N-acetylmuramoyl-L-alanine--D-glutamate ligase [Brevundimonas mediterranea]